MEGSGTSGTLNDAAPPLFLSRPGQKSQSVCRGGKVTVASVEAVVAAVAVQFPRANPNLVRARVDHNIAKLRLLFRQLCHRVIILSTTECGRPATKQHLQDRHAVPIA